MRLSRRFTIETGLASSWALDVIEAVEAEGGKVVRIVTIVDREEGAAEIIREAGYTYSPILTLRDFL